MRSTPGAGDQLVADDLAKLQTISEDPTIPDVTKRVLHEVLWHLERVALTEASGAGAKFLHVDVGIGGGYLVKHKSDVGGGTAERLGSLTHELTHVSVSESFQNTALFLAVSRGATDEQILALSRMRTQQLDDLLGLARSSSFAASQLQLLVQKLEYPAIHVREGDLTRYLRTMERQLDEEQLARFRRLAAAGANNSLIEFDTVVNQMLVYMHVWQTPLDDPFYVRLRDVAEQAYSARAAARELNPPPVTPAPEPAGAPAG